MLTLVRSHSAALLIGLLLAPGLATADTAPAPIAVANAWARATPGGAKVGAAYLQITAAADDALISVSSPRAGRVELHTHLTEDGVMKMRKVEKLTVGPAKAVTLAPGGDHLMLFDLPQPLQEGEKLPLMLVFEKAGSVAVEATILGVGAAAPGAAPAGGSAAPEHKHH